MRTIQLYIFSILIFCSTQTNAQLFGGQIKPNVGKVSQLNCSNAAVSGSIYSGVNVSGILVSLPYLGGNGGVITTNTFSSTNVTGLFASNASGQLNQGSGTLYFSIFGTATNSGTATFNISIGGQICQLNINVLPLANLYPQNSVFCASGPTAIVDITNPTTGKTWMDRNLGAGQVATSTTDAQAYGDLYQWGRRSDGHQCRTSATSSTLSSIDQPAHGNFILAPNSPTDWRSPQNDNLWQGVFGTNNPCPNGYRIPTENELNLEKGTWSNQNSSGAFASNLKITLSGDRFNNNGTIVGTNQYATLWTNTVATTFSKDLFITTSSNGFNNNDRADGRSVRCIKETTGSIGALDCTNYTQTGNLVIAQAASSVIVNVPYTNGNAGFYPSQTLTSLGITGLTAALSQGMLASGSGTLTFTISGTPTGSGTASFTLVIGGQNCTLNLIVYGEQPQYPAGSVFCNGITTIVNDVTNPSTGGTWMDRNLGASQVATSTSDAAAFGDLYQWGRGNDGHQCRNSATTTTLSSTNQPGNGNFIITSVNPRDWRNPSNNNLWQGLNGINNPCPVGYRIPTDTELQAEANTWSNLNTLFKVTLGGSRRGNTGTISNTSGYWSSTSSGGSASEDLVVSINSVSNTFNADLNGEDRSRGYSIRCIKELVGTIGTLRCYSASVAGTLYSGTAASGVSASVQYSLGNNGLYNAQSVSSTGVTGLTATISQGFFTSGLGSLIYNITGTPNSSGTASFALNIGGKSCTLTIPVANNLATQYPAGSVFCSSGPTAIVDVTNPTTGKIWMDRNLGASQAATSSTDALAYGDLYQWGRGNDGHQCRNSTTSTTLSSTDQTVHGQFIIAASAPYDWRSPQNNNLWQGVNGINNPCPTGYRLPTELELNNEMQSWNSASSAGAYASPLKFTLAGDRSSLNTGIISNIGTEGRYNSSSVQVNGIGQRHLYFYSGAYIDQNDRQAGQSIRCIKDASAIIGTIGTINCGGTTNTGTLTHGTAASGVSSSVPYTGGNGGSHSGQAVFSTGVTGLTATLATGIFENGSGSLIYNITGTPNSSGTASFALNIGGKSCTLTIPVEINWATQYPAGSIFCSSGPTTIVDVTNPTTGKIWMDRNLGASQTATSSTDALAYGDVYQWGRGNDGHQCRNSTTSTTLSSTDQTGHGQFIIVTNSPYDWRSTQNDNLWQGVTGTNNPCPSGYRIPTEIELDQERSSWTSNDSTGAFNSPLKLTLTGYRNVTNGILTLVSSRGYYWSSSINGGNSRNLIYTLNLNNAWHADDIRASGESVRCIKN